jgi:type IV pilus assembly protein PilA
MSDRAVRFRLYFSHRRAAAVRATQQGFTLVELMIIVAIIGILSAVALPAYQDYTIRAKMAEAVLAASSCRTAITEAYQTSGTAPGAGSWGCEGHRSKYVADIETDANGVVTVTVQGVSTSVDGKKLSMTPYIGGVPADAGTMMGQGISEWRCGPASSNAVSAKHLPSSCRGA